MKRTILIPLGYYLPGFKAGGPIRSIEGLVGALGEELEFKIIAMDRDLGDKAPYTGIQSDRWMRVGPANVYYLKPGWRGLLSLASLLNSGSHGAILYLNSLFSRQFSMFAILMWKLGLCRPRGVVLAPRGELSPGALNLKGRRKHLYMEVTNLLNIYKGIVWHASTALEVEDIRRNFSQAARIVMARPFTQASGHRFIQHSDRVFPARDINLPQESPVYERGQKIAGRLRAVFVSRISPKKNLLYAIRLLANLQGKIEFDIYGPTEDKAYWQECQDAIGLLPLNIKAEYCGEITHAKVCQVFAGHDLFLFPTLGENYGHVICESLAAGCPVLISDQTPWRNLEELGIGWDVPIEEPEQFRAVLQQCIDADEKLYSTISARAVEYANKAISSPEVIEANRKLFEYALE